VLYACDKLITLVVLFICSLLCLTLSCSQLFRLFFLQYFISYLHLTNNCYTICLRVIYFGKKCALFMVTWKMWKSLAIYWVSEKIMFGN